MPKPRTKTGEKNLISQQLIALRKQYNYSQRDLSCRLQLAGYDMDKNVITRIETNQRYVTDLELQAFSRIFHVSYDYLIAPDPSFFLLLIVPGNLCTSRIWAAAFKSIHRTYQTGCSETVQI